MPFVGTSYIGEGFLMASFVLCLIHLLKPIHNIGRYVFSLTLISFMAFMYGHISNDFSMLNVVLHSHRDKPLLYKIAGTWASHEGSMLFWCVLLSGYACIARFFEKNEDVWRTQESLFTLLIFGFLLFTYLTNPFTRLMAPVRQGMDLNPVLQDISLVIHPPHLYLGTIGFALPFIQALSYLRHKTDSVIARPTLFSTLLIALFFQTSGVILGSAWAYYELGWGGWWFFDPVENLALIPWLMGLVTLHLLILLKHNESLYGWALMGCLKTFSLCLLSLTLIRAGLLNSVHAFGSDPEKGLLLGSIFVLWSLTATIFYFRFRGGINIKISFQKLTLENLTFVGIVFLTLALLTLTVGTLAPVIADSVDSTLILGMGYFLQSFIPPVLMAGVCLIIVLIKTNWSKKNLIKHMAHGGFYISIIGIALSSFLDEEKEIIMTEGKTLSFHGYTITLDHFEVVNRSNHTAALAHMKIGGKPATPEERFYHTQNNLHRETSIVTLNGLHQIHLLVGDTGTHEKTGLKQGTVKIIYKPFITIMWFGFFMITLGVLISMLSAVSNHLGRRPQRSQAV